MAAAAEAQVVNFPRQSALRVGSRGVEVGALQRALRTVGLPTNDIDGVFGESTATAVKMFQASRGLTQTGIADEVTVSFLPVAVRPRQQLALAKNPDPSAAVGDAAATDAAGDEVRKYLLWGFVAAVAFGAGYWFARRPVASHVGDMIGGGGDGCRRCRHPKKDALIEAKVLSKEVHTS